MARGYALNRCVGIGENIKVTVKGAENAPGSSATCVGVSRVMGFICMYVWVFYIMHLNRSKFWDGIRITPAWTPQSIVCVCLLM